MSEDQVNVEELLQKAKKPAADALKLHPFYKGKMETTLKCTVRDIDDFAIWYTPGVAAPCREIQEDQEKVYRHTRVQAANHQHRYRLPGLGLSGEPTGVHTRATGKRRRLV